MKRYEWIMRIVVLSTMLLFCAFFNSETGRAKAAGTYNAEKAARYAETHYNDFCSEHCWIDDKGNVHGGDCAHFIWQCLNEGGLSLDKMTIPNCFNQSGSPYSWCPSQVQYLSQEHIVYIYPNSYTKQYENVFQSKAFTNRDIEIGDILYADGLSGELNGAPDHVYIYCQLLQGAVVYRR